MEICREALCFLILSPEMIHVTRLRFTYFCLMYFPLAGDPTVSLPCCLRFVSVKPWVYVILDLSNATVFNSIRVNLLLCGTTLTGSRKGDILMIIYRNCKKRMVLPGTSGTSHLRNHLTGLKRWGNHDIGRFISRGKKWLQPLGLGK